MDFNFRFLLLTYIPVIIVASIVAMQDITMNKKVLENVEVSRRSDKTSAALGSMASRAINLPTNSLRTEQQQTREKRKTCPWGLADSKEHGLCVDMKRSSCPPGSKPSPEHPWLCISSLGMTAKRSICPPGYKVVLNKCLRLPAMRRGANFISKIER
ncbi:uncharacterized protein LOC132758470 [Ruditapes philippinarum]|uniref:uncharacterized protein LOC132758470 n=1 Tax=Ruditapes philippinarum TaxID=129788 RepID=UPI00295B7ECF|nr:uncharacterized protein LOC132758470 [Ruditapes philippinarum]